MTLGKRIARARKLRGLTQQDIGDVFGISDKAVSGWERDKESPGLEKVPALRRKLRVTFSWLLEGSGAPPDENAPEVLLDDLSGPEQEAVRAGVSAMIESLRKQRDVA